MIAIILDSTLCWKITLTLLHVSWIGMLVGLISAIASRALSHSSASRRYWLHLTSLVVLASSLPITFATVRGLPLEDSPTAASTLPLISIPETSATNSPVEAFDDASHGDSSIAKDATHASKEQSSADDAVISGSQPVTDRAVTLALRDLTKRVAPYVTFAYTLGVLLMLIKLAISVRFTHHLQSAGRPIQDPGLLIRLAEHAQKLSLKVLPVIATCEQVTVPIVVGLLRPMILIPTAMISGLTLEQLDAVLTHELAHLRRRDHMVIVVQRLLEAMLFFHPVTWYLSRQIHHERECSCDDLVVSIGRDRLQYAQSLLRVAELQKGISTRREHMALAADGQSPSKLRLRIAKILGPERENPVRVNSVWLCVLIVSCLAAGICFVASKSIYASPVTATDSQISETIPPQDKPFPTYQEILTRMSSARVGVTDAKTIQVAFRRYRKTRQFKTGLTPAACQHLIENHDLLKVPDFEMSQRLIVSLHDGNEASAAASWSEKTLYRQGTQIRLSTISRDRPQDELLLNDHEAVEWNGENHQMGLVSVKQPHIRHRTLDDLFVGPVPFVAPQGHSPFITQVDEHYILRDKATSPLVECLVNSRTYCIERFTTRHDPKTMQDRFYLGWRLHYQNVWFPKVVLRFSYNDAELSDFEALVFDKVSFNTALPDDVFKLGAPAGSVIVDSRDGQDRVGKINRDVFDVTSIEQVQAATTPLRTELTPEEKAGVAEARVLYSLPDGAALKRVGPPFSLARKYVSRMLEETTAHRPGQISRVIEWNGTRFRHVDYFVGGSYTVRHLVMRFADVGEPELEIDADLKKLPIPGDFVFREGASKDDLLQALQLIVSDEARTPVSMEFRDVERTVYTASGKFQMNLPKGKSLIEINGGDHTGDLVIVNNGNVDTMLHSLAAYINLRIINNVEQHDKTFRWSERSYRRESTSTEDRFQVDPAFTLKQITEQTGIQFTKEKQLVRTLFVESKSPAEKAAR